MPTNTTLMHRMHKPDQELGPDQHDKRSLALLEQRDFDQWLASTVQEARALVQLTPVELFDAGPLEPTQPELV